MAPAKDEPSQRRVAVITGGAGMIGAALCETLALQGVLVVMLDRDSNCLRSAFENHTERVGRQCTMIPADISTKRGAFAAIDQVIDAHGKVDILVNNAATKSSSLESFYIPDIDYEESTWNEVMATNLNGAFFMCQAVGRNMLERRNGIIINVASIYGVVGADQRIYKDSQYRGHKMSLPAVYAASKAGLLGLTRHLAAAWGPLGVRVNAVTPGGVEGEHNQQFTDNYRYRVPLGRMARAQEIVTAISFLASETASYINGHNLVVDGGLTTW